jgi:hypothetical protein
VDSRRRRRWRRENADEITRIIAWINAPNCFVPAGPPDNKGIIEMEVERVAAFGQEFPMPKNHWKNFLIRKGISPEKFRISGGQAGP